MSLIKDNQRKKSGTTVPQIKPLPSVKPAAPAQQLEEMQTPAATAPTGDLVQPVSAPTPAATNEQLQIGEGTYPEIFPPVDATTDPPEPPLTPAAAPADQAVLEALDVAPAPFQDGVGTGTRYPTEAEILKGVGQFQLPSILNDIGNEQGDDRLYAPETIITKVPSVYNTLNTNSTRDLVKQGYAGINDAVGRRNAETAAATARSQEVLENRNRLLNVPRVDKPWNASPAENSNNPFMDILFGKEEHRKEQPFKPQEGSYGKQGAGLFGGLNYLLNLPLNASVAVAGEVNEAAANILQTFGVKKEDARNFARNGVLGLLPERMRPSSVLGFDWKKAEERNLIHDALVGDPVGDTNDPKGKNKGVYFSPRRATTVRSRQIENGSPLSKIDQAFNDVVAVAQNDPIGTVIEVGTQLFNPGDIIVDNVWTAAWRKFATKKAAPAAAAQAVPQTPKPPKKGGAIVKRQPFAEPIGNGIKVEMGSAEWEPPIPVNPNAIVKKQAPAAGGTVNPPRIQMEAVLEKPSRFPATEPTKSPRILIGETEVVQKALPPTIEKSAVEGIPYVEFVNTPAGTAMKVGVGKPSEIPIEVPPVVTVKGVDDLPGGIGSASTDDLIEAAEQLAAHKAAVAQPQKQLDDLFETTVDFGRKPVDNVPYENLTPDAAYRTIANGARFNIPDQAFERLQVLMPDIVPLLRESNYDDLSSLMVRQGITMREIAKLVSEANNAALADIAVTVTSPAAKYVAQMPAKLYHGTALADWTPNYNLRINGSRGELGAGLYLIEKPMIAKNYAAATMGENVPAGALNKEISPAVYDISHSFKATLDARAKMPSSEPMLKQLLDGLPEELQKNVMRSLQRDKNASYVSLWNKLEANLVRSGLEPTEETLRTVNNVVSENLRTLGYDSVYDAKSGFALALDETKVIKGEARPVPTAAHPMRGLEARYNADAYTAKYFPERVSTDANLRDSAAKILNQVEDSIDQKLRKVQQEIIKRGQEPRDTVLPPRESFRRTEAQPKPATMEEALKDIPARSDNPCQP